MCVFKKDENEIPNVNVCQAESLSTKKFIASAVRDLVEKYEVMDRNIKKETAQAKGLDKT